MLRKKSSFFCVFGQFLNRLPQQN